MYQLLRGEKEERRTRYAQGQRTLSLLAKFVEQQVAFIDKDGLQHG
jgi:hypothetical protein